MPLNKNPTGVICLFTAATLLFALSSCQTILLMAYGVKKPRPISDDKISARALQYEMDTTHLYTIMPSKYVAVINEVASGPNVFIYDRAGNRYNYQSDSVETCKGRVEGFIEDLNTNVKYDLANDSSFFRFQHAMEKADGQAFANQVLPEADCYLLVFWATWLGRLNKQYIPDWKAAAQNNPNVKMHILYVSCDMRKAWKPPTVDQ